MLKEKSCIDKSSKFVLMTSLFPPKDEDSKWVLDREVWILITAKLMM